MFDAQTAIAQLGGSTGQLALLVGARDFVKSDADGYVQFSFKGCRKANKCRVTLTPADTYTLTFFKFDRKSFECPVVGEFDDVYCDQLTDLFEDFTGLYLTLHARS